MSNGVRQNFWLAARYAAAGFLANFFWEVCHSLNLYAGFEAIGARHVPSLTGYLKLMLYVSTVDMLLLVGMLAGGVLIWKQVRWFDVMSGRKYAYVIAVCLALAVWVEWRGVYWLGKWSYNEVMPTVFGLGLSPLLQLPVTGLFSMWIVKGDSNSILANTRRSPDHTPSHPSPWKGEGDRR